MICLVCTITFGNMFSSITFLVLGFDLYLLSALLENNEQFKGAKDNLTAVISDKVGLLSSLIPKYTEKEKNE